MRTIRATLVALLTTFALLPAASVLASHGGVIFDNGGPGVGGGWQVEGGAVAADDFVLPAGGTVGGAGVYLADSYLRPMSFGGSVNWHVFADAGGQPASSPIASGAGVNPALTNSGLPATGGLGYIYLLEFDFDTPFQADPGVVYWFGIDLPGAPFGVYWEESSSPGNSARATGAFPVSWSQSDFELAFYLTSDEAAPPEPDLALFDPATGEWHLRTAAGIHSFYFGVPGDTPLLGDWDCDGNDTVAMYRESNGFVYYRNSNDFGVADGSFYFGIPGDIPIAGDWNNDGCDTFGIYRNGKVYYRNQLSTGYAALAYWFGVPGDVPFAGDFNGDGWDTIGLYRSSTGFVHYSNAVPAHNSVAPTRDSFFYGVPSDRVIAGDWDDEGFETVGLFRSTDERFHLRNSNSTGPADITIDFGQGSWLPAAGDFG